MALKDDLAKTIRKTERLARQNYLAAYTLAACSAVASLAAAFFAATGSKNTALIGLLGAVPAAVLAANAVMKFDSKSSWHWRKAKRLGALLRALQYEGMSEADAAAKWSELETDIERDWQPFGGLTPPTERGGS